MSEDLRDAILLELDRWYTEKPSKLVDDKELMETFGIDDQREIQRNFEILEEHGQVTVIKTGGGWEAQIKPAGLERAEQVREQRGASVEVYDAAEQLIDGALGGSNQELRRDISAVLADQSQAGVLLSGITFARIKEAGEREIGRRAGIISDSWQRALSAYSDPVAKEEVLERASGKLESHLSEIETAVTTLTPKEVRKMVQTGIDDLRKSFYDARKKLLAELSLAIAQREQPIIAEAEILPTAPSISMDFIRNEDIRKQAESDYREIQECHRSESWKAAIVLTGSCLEGMLLDQILQRQVELESTTSAPPRDPYEWNLFEVVNVCVELGIIKAAQFNLSEAVREFRNVIHPGRIIRKEIQFGREEARIGLETLKALIRDLSRQAASS